MKQGSVGKVEEHSYLFSLMNLAKAFITVLARDKQIREVSIGKDNREGSHTSLEKVKCSEIYLSLFYYLKHEKEAEETECQ